MVVRVRDVWLDYAAAASDRKLLENVSGISWADPFLWTVSDEGRTCECFEPHGDGFRLHRHIPLDALFEGLPGHRKQAEADIKSIDVVGGTVWLCGSHCIVRRQINKTNSDVVDPRFRYQRAGAFLAAFLSLPL